MNLLIGLLVPIILKFMPVVPPMRLAAYIIAVRDALAKRWGKLCGCTAVLPLHIV